MKNIYHYVLVVMCAFVTNVQALEANEVIPSFDARITVQENATIEVIERIEYDFGNAQKHGIFRNIPYSYQTGTETYTANISSVVVTDELGKPRPFGESRGNGELTLKIGDPDIVVSGKQVYVISYLVEGPFLFLDEYDELYWNVTGFWEKSITQASVLVDLPIGAQVLSASCYKGGDGSTTACDSDERLVNVERAGYTAKANLLNEKEGLTIAISFPKGVITAPEKKEHADHTFTWYHLTPLLLPIVILFFMIRLWVMRGKDPKGNTAVVTQFTPPEHVSPALAGVVYSEKVTGREISAEIIRLAVDGYITIHRLEEKVLLIIPKIDYLLERTNEKKPDDEIGALVLEKIFQPVFTVEKECNGEKKEGVLLSKMEHEFVQEKKEIDACVYKQAHASGFFAERPDMVRRKYYLIGGLSSVAGFFIFLYGGAMTLLLLFVGIALLLSGMIMVIVGRLMPVRTTEGVVLKDYLEGFKRYLSIAEKDRIAFHSSPDQIASEPQRTMQLFDICLPYAMIFAVEEKWAEQFKEIYKEEPTWFRGNGAQVFTVTAFASDIAHFAHDLHTATMPQSSGSHGGGSSGGGFGGGGGGSW